MSPPILAPDHGMLGAEVRVSTRSLLGDRVWHLDGIRPGGNRSDFSLDWGFRMHDDSRFSDLQWENWSAAAKRFLWSLKIDPPPGRQGVHDGTLISAFKVLRILIRWMAERGARCFADLHRDDAVEFIDVVAKRPGRTAGKTLSAATLSSYYGVLQLLYLQGSRLPEVSIDEPIAASIKHSKHKDGGWLPYTPDEIAVPLVSAALRLIGTPADDVIALWHRSQAVYDEVLRAGISQTKAGFMVVDALGDFSFSTLPGDDKPWHSTPVANTKQIRALVARISEACFIVVAYLIGARVSEILGLQTGCIERHPSADGTEQFAYLVGRIYKTSRGAEGGPHRWVAPVPVERAIAVMEGLSAPMRQRSQRAELWLSFKSPGLLGPASRIELPATNTVVGRLRVANKTFLASLLLLAVPLYCLRRRA